jgi:phosphonate transport system substrate-binding protein
MVSLALAFVVAAGAACSDRPPAPFDPVLRVAAVASRPGNPQEHFHPLVTYLGERLGVRVELVPVRKNDTAVELFVRGYVTLAWLDGLGGVRARHEVPGATAIAQGDTDHEHFTVIVAHRLTGIEPSTRFPPALSRARFTFGPEGSLAEHLMPEYFLWRATGLWPEQFFVRPVTFSQGSDHTLSGIETGEFEAGAVDRDAYAEQLRTGRVSSDIVRVVWTTPPYATHHWTAHPILEQHFGPGFIARLQDALLAIDDPTVLAGLDRQHLVPASDRLYDGIRIVAVERGLLR